MSSRAARWAWGLGLAQLVLLVATFYVPGFGADTWHHLASLGLTLALSAALWRPLTTSRRFLALGVLSSTVLATISGFYLLYWKEGIRIDGYQDWGVWWHVFWSWIAAVFFLMHPWINRRQLGLFYRRSMASVPRRLVHMGGYVLLLAAFSWTWLTGAKASFTSANYIQLSFYAWLVTLVPSYAVWLSVRLRGGATALSGRLGALVAHWPVRCFVDLVLVPLSVLVVASGVLLTFFDDYTDPLGLKYVSKYWHVWPSVVFSVAVFTHSVQAWSTVRTHWRSYARTRPDAPPPGPPPSAATKGH